TVRPSATFLGPVLKALYPSIDHREVVLCHHCRRGGRPPPAPVILSLPQRRRARRAGGQGDPRHPRQLRRAQARQGAALADPVSAVDLPLHPPPRAPGRTRSRPVRQARQNASSNAAYSPSSSPCKINGFVAARNRDPRPFVWKADPK